MNFLKNKLFRSIILPVIVILGTVYPLYGQEYDLKLHLKISGLRTAEPPQIFREKIILSYSSRYGTGYVGAVFAHEEYRTVHPYQLNGHGVFVLSMDIPPEIDILQYRIVVDGLWMADPLAEGTARFPSGIEISQLSLPQNIDPAVESPVPLGNGYVRFSYPADSGKSIFLAGSFNNWDPFMYRLTEKETGVYSITVKLPPGTHHYYYLTDGERETDPLNPMTVVTMSGKHYSVVSLR
jgi:hypothetical protein